MERILGLDLGERRIGIALSDPLGITAQPLGVLQSTGWGPDIRYLTALAAEHGARRFVLGLPLSMDGSLGPQAEKVQRFGQQLEKAGFHVNYQDERLTSVSAHRVLSESGLSQAQQRGHVDKIAAAIVLQSYLDTNQKEESPMEDQENSIVELIGEDGTPESFEHLMTLEHKGQTYLVLTPVTDGQDEEAEEAEVVILRMGKDDEGNECYLSEEDEGIQQAVFERFIELMELEDDAPDEEEE